jgi:hypothetical protein
MVCLVRRAGATCADGGSVAHARADQLTVQLAEAQREATELREAVKAFGRDAATKGWA